MRRLRPLLLAWAQQGAGDPGAALQGLAQAAAADVPARGIYDLHAGMIADIDGRTADADRLYGAARAAFQGDNLRLAQVLASWQARQGHTEAADATLRAAIASDPDLAIAEPGLLHGIATRPVSRATEGMAEAYLATAAALRQQDQLDDALLLLRLAADLRPDFAAARLLAAEIDDDTDHPDAGLAALSHVALNDPLAPVVRLRRAWLMEETGDDAASQRELTQLIREQPDRPEPEKALADLLRREGHDRASLPHYDRAVVLARGRDGTWGRSDWSLFYARGLALEAVQEPAQAEADFEHALALDPDQPEILNYLGYAWAEQGRHLKRARQMIERAVALRPNDGNLIDSLGWVQLRQGDKAAAVRTLEQATELEPEDPVINAHLGDAYWEDGRKREAEFQWRRALNLHPAPEEAARLEAKLGASPVVAGAAQDRSLR
jgi:tetratricopeptide (TPR) repeat protein